MDNVIWQAISGIGVVIDDKCKDLSNIIQNIIAQLERENIPLITRSTLPSDEFLDNLKNISFIILDWRLNDLTEEQKNAGITLSSTEKTSVDVINNIAFLRKIKERKFLPVFIITNEDIVKIEELLKSNNLLEDGKPRFIFVKSKDALKEGGALRSSMINWVKSSAPIYLLKMFEASFSDAKDSTFSMFYKLSPSWVKIFYDTAKNDDADPIQDINELIIKNIEGRIYPLELDENIIKSQAAATISSKEHASVFQGRVIIPADCISQVIIDTGYLYYDKAEKKYCINVTPSCDNLRKNNCLLLYGEHNDAIQVSKQKYQNYNKTMHHMCFVGENLHITFYFDELKIIEKKELLNQYSQFSLIGKVISPYITDLQLRMSSYLIRQGLPSVPSSLISGNEKDENKFSTNMGIIDKMNRILRKYFYKIKNTLFFKKKTKKKHKKVTTKH